MSANRDFFGASSVTDFLGERYHVTLAYVVAKLATPSDCLDCHLSVCLSVCYSVTLVHSTQRFKLFANTVFLHCL